MKGNPQTRKIPIVALSAHALAGEREKALAAGCDEFDTKPIEFDRLVDATCRGLSPAPVSRVALMTKRPGQNLAHDFDGDGQPWVYCCCGMRTGGHFATALSISSAVSSGLIVTRANPAAFVLNWAVAAAISSGYPIRVGGGRAVIEKPKFELASDRLDKLGDTYLKGRGRLLL